MGTYNSGCAKIEVPVLNQSSMLMVSHANTNPGLTKKWDAGEPDKYYPTGQRNYARVVTTDDVQGPAAAQFVAKDLKVTKCYVLDDTETYGKGVADTFQAEATKQGIQVVGRGTWKKGGGPFTTVMTAAKTAGADCIFFGGIDDNDGDQLMKDKFTILGDNNAVKVIAPDGFTGYPNFNKLPESQGVYLTFAGLSTDVLKANGGVPAKFLSDYQAKYGQAPASSYALYGVQALQVILAAIAASDGTRDGVRKAVFSGSGITIAADKAVVGKGISIDPATGDVNAKDITVEVVKGNDETFLKAWPVS
jgi:branched-chain amino acid transport system substrate-binding protein